MALDRDSISAPIAGDQPSGEWLRREGTYAAVKEAMRHDPGDHAYGIPEKRSDWGEVVSLCQAALAEKTKDFYLAVCLLEGLVRTQGCTGLRDGLWVIAELHEKFWPSFHPQPRDEGQNIDGRVNQLDALAQNWNRVLDGLPMNEGHTVITRLDWNRADGPYSADDQASAVSSSSWDFYDTAVRALRDADTELRRLDDLLDVHYGREAVSLSDAKAALAETIGTFEGLLREKGPSPYEEQARGFLQQTACDFIELEWLAERVRDGLSTARGLNSIQAAVNDNAAGVVPEGGWQAFLGAKWDAGETYEQQTEGPPAPVVAETPVAATGAAPTIAVPVAAPGGDPKAAVLGACRAWRAADPEAPLPYVLTRQILWSALERADRSEPQPAPAAGMRQKCQSLFDAGQWPDLLELCEATIESGQAPAWLDLQRYACAAMGQIGHPYGVPREAIIKALAGMLSRTNWLREADLDDGAPAADEITRNWIGDEVGAAMPRGPAAVAQGPSNEAVLEKALELLETEGLEAAVDHVQSEAAKADGIRERALRRRDMGELCLAAQRPELAAPVLEGLREDIHNRELGVWEGTAFLGRTLEALYRSYRLLSVAQPSSEWDESMRSVADELAHVDLARRIRLEAST